MRAPIEEINEVKRLKKEFLNTLSEKQQVYSKKRINRDIRNYRNIDILTVVKEAIESEKNKIEYSIKRKLKTEQDNAERKEFEEKYRRQYNLMRVMPAAQKTYTPRDYINLKTEAKWVEFIAQKRGWNTTLMESTNHDL